MDGKTCETISVFGEMNISMYQTCKSLNKKGKSNLDEIRQNMNFLQNFIEENSP